MKNTRRKFNSGFKAKVVVEALNERRTISELAEQYQLHANQIKKWKKEFLESYVQREKQQKRFAFYDK